MKDASSPTSPRPTSPVTSERKSDIEAKPSSEAPALALNYAGSAGAFSSSLNLLKSIIGAGMLSLPFAVSLVGILPAAILLIISLIMAVLGLFFLALCADRVCNRDATFASVSKHTFPSLSPLFDAAIAIKCVGVAISYLSIVADLLPIVIEAIFFDGLETGTQPTSGAGKVFTSRLFWVSATVLGIAPVVFLPKMDSLKYTSFFGLGSVAYLLVLSFVLLGQQWKELGNPFGQGFALFVPLTWSSMKSFSIFVFAFTCHQNLFPILNEARDNKPRPIMRIVNACMLIAFGIYFSFAAASFAVFPKPTANIIRTYPVKGAQFIIARFLYALLVIFSYPLQSFPCRMSVQKFISYFWPSAAVKYEQYLYYSITTVVLVLTWGIAAINPPLDVVLSIIGSTAGPMICYILPSLFWLKLEKGYPWNWTSITALCLLVFGIFATFVPLVSIIVSLVLR